jgi:hypothetical protein
LCRDDFILFFADDEEAETRLSSLPGIVTGLCCRVAAAATPCLARLLHPRSNDVFFLALLSAQSKECNALLPESRKGSG